MFCEALDPAGAEFLRCQGIQIAENGEGFGTIPKRKFPKLLRELKPGTRVISHDFSMGAWEPDNSTVVEEKFDYIPFHDSRLVDDYWEKHTIYYWIIPANVTEKWKDKRR